MNIIKTISKEKLVILVTHETNLAKFYASRIIEIKNGKVEKDYKNENADELDYRLENKIYLKDIQSIQKIQNENLNLNLYTENKEKIDIKLVVKNGNIYIQSENQKIEVVDENSAVELIDSHYEKIDKSTYEEYKYDLRKNIRQKHKTKI